jgi:hypothetical protein
MRERKIEKAFKAEAKKRGYLPLKFTSPGRRGVPDQLVLGPNARVFFVEVKAPGKETTSNQKREIARYDALGHTVYVLDNLEDIPGIFIAEKANEIWNSAQNSPVG